MAMREAIAIAAILALAACGNPAPRSDNPLPESAPETPIPVEPDGGIGDGAGPPGEVEDTLANRIPTRFQGVWDYVEGTCARESDMRMEISGGEILFYESVGLVTNVKPEGNDVVVTLSMEGEGETWEQQTRLSLVGEGDVQRLETSDGEFLKKTDEYPSKRCPE